MLVEETMSESPISSDSTHVPLGGTERAPFSLPLEHFERDARIRNTTKSQPFRASLSWKFDVLAALRGSKKRGLDKKKREMGWRDI